jgi:hypothetical protein
MQEKTKHKLFLSLQFTTSVFGFSLLTNERKKERKKEGRRIEGQNMG